MFPTSLTSASGRLNQRTRSKRHRNFRVTECEEVGRGDNR